MAELGNLRERFDYAVDTRGFDISAMGRLFAPKVLPDSVRKALYLDCDTIVNGSIRPLYETELGNHLAGMVLSLIHILLSNSYQCMKALAEDIGKAVLLGKIDGEKILYIAKCEPKHPVVMTPSIGDCLLYTSCNGGFNNKTGRNE